MNKILNSNRVTLDFSELTVKFTVDGETLTYCKGEPILQQTLSSLFDKTASIFVGSSNIFNLNGPGLLAENSNLSNETKYYLVPHRVRTFILSDTLYYKVIEIDDSGSEYFTQIDEKLYKVDALVLPMILIVTQKYNKVETVFGGYVDPKYYNMTEYMLNIKTVADFNSLALRGEFSNHYSNLKLCLTVDSLEPNLKSILTAIDWGVNNTDLFAPRFVENFIKRVKLARKPITQSVLEDAYSDLETSVKTISEISPLIVKGS